ncbi:MAG: hypothetical protein N2446_00230 [Elusimicrobiales bacterium]|nr:hypothetical protein [Elusimicrobiales bacterium]
MNSILFLFLSFLFSQDLAFQRPEPKKIMELISELELSQQQKQDIEEELIINLKKYDKVRKKYEKKVKEREKLEKEIESIKLEMIELNKNVTSIVKNFLTDEQKIRFTDIIKKQREKIKEQKDQELKKVDKVQEDEKKEDSYIEKTSPFNIYFP